MLLIYLVVSRWIVDTWLPQLRLQMIEQYRKRMGMNKLIPLPYNVYDESDAGINIIVGCAAFQIYGAPNLAM